tara:strand:+ start:257 stop:1996 length:1740 start_codon:yes stop_codon:yes gene_type:complete
LRLLQYQFPYKTYTFWGILSLIAASAATGAAPAAISRAIDDGIATRDLDQLLVFTAFAAGLFMIRGFMAAIYNFTWQYASQIVARDLRDEFFAHLQRLPHKFHDGADSGDLISRGISDIEAGRMAGGMSLYRLVEIVATYLVVISIMIATHVQLTLLTLATLPLMMIITIYFSYQLRLRWSRVQAQRAILTSTLTEALTGIRVVKAFNQEEGEIDKFEQNANDLSVYVLDTLKQFALFLPVLLFFSSVGTVVLIWAGFSLVLDGSLDLGTIVQFNIYVVNLLRPTRMIGPVVQRLQNGLVAAERVFEILDIDPEITSPLKSIKKPIHGNIRFDNVKFSYGDSTPVLSNINFELKAGKTLGIIGPTGAGKSTLVGLIPRLYEVTSGTVLLDGVELSSYDLEHLRNNIAMVPQDPFLFTNSIGKNIAFARPKSDLKQIISAAVQAQADRFISKLDGDYDTVVGERGVGLSGGQRQRSTIARALIMNAPILIMDDCTASVDTETEQLIRDGLKRELNAKTLVVVGQRVSSVRHSDEILVLDKGRIVERGSHSELITLDGLYAEIHRLQSPEQEAAVDGAHLT